RLWDMTKMPPALQADLEPSSTPMSALAVAPNGKLLAAGGADTSIRLWDLDGKDTKLRTKVEGHTGPIASLSFSADTRGLASASHDGTVRLWSVASEGRPVEKAVLRGHAKE